MMFAKKRLYISLIALMFKRVAACNQARRKAGGVKPLCRISRSPSLSFLSFLILGTKSRVRVPLHAFCIFDFPSLGRWEEEA